MSEKKYAVQLYVAFVIAEGKLRRHVCCHI